MTSRSDRLKAYLRMIKRKEGAESVLDPKAERGWVLESVPPQRQDTVGSSLEAFHKDKDLTPEQMDVLEALIIPDLRPAVDIINDRFEVKHPLWTHLSTDSAIRGRIEGAIPLIGRIELPGNPTYPYGGTGFVVGDGLLMTNRHVAAIFANGLGDRNLGFKTGHRAGINFRRERGGSEAVTLTVHRVVMIHPYWDMALLSVEGLPAGHKSLTLSVDDDFSNDGREIVVIGYPAFDPRNNAIEQDKLFDKTYGIKRLQPGQLHGRADTESFGKIVSAAAHDCSTLGGNSGSGVFDPKKDEVVALHFGGLYHDKNFAVPAFELARDGRVVDAGVKFAKGAPGGSPQWSDWWRRADLVERAVASPVASVTTTPAASTVSNGGNSVSVSRSYGEVTVEIPLHITVRLGQPLTTSAKPAVEGVTNESAALEALVEPWRDENYDSREGYNPDFLGVRVPMPSAADPGVIAPTRDGGTVLHYGHFSIQMNASRRLALFTASNVTADPSLKKPDKNRDYGRRGLSGLGENDQEKWFVDPRMDEKYQLPDTFFTKDRKAFDKGHIVRREDVAWGETYAELRQANGDTYHVTNCSPQVAGFNRSNAGVENWGDLENHVLSGAAKESLTVFAGPVLDPSDTVFVGTGGGGQQIRAKIPTRFWKVVVAAVHDGIAAYGFVLEQDLSDVAFEFVVPEEFVAHMYPIADIEEMTGVRFDKVVMENDQYETARGTEVARTAGTTRRRRKK